MQLRRLEWGSLLTAGAVGALLVPGTLSGDAGKLLITFLGLVSASILPTISLIIGSMSASGRSVQAVNDLRDELAAGMDALFLLFGLVGISVVSLLSLAINPPKFFDLIPFLDETLARAGQSIVMSAATLIVMRSGQIPGILRRTLGIRHRIAVEEARLKILERSPSPDAVKSAFGTHPEFGKSVTLADIQEGERH